MERLDDTGERGPIQPRDARAVVGAYYGLENDHLHQKGREARLLELPRIHFAVKRLAAYPDGRLVDLFARRRPSAHALVLDVEGELPSSMYVSAQASFRRSGNSGGARTTFCTIASGERRMTS